MKKKIALIWIVLSVILIVVNGVIFDAGSPNVMVQCLYGVGWISVILAVGYFIFPTDTMTGKIAFGCYGVVVAGLILVFLQIAGGTYVMLSGMLGTTLAIVSIAIRRT